MKRVETIHINGIVFSITDDAYSKLSTYLDTLRKKFENEQEGEEIIADIEARISELFAERDGGKSRVVILEDVIEVIATLGTPEDIADTDDSETGTPPPHRSSQTEKKPKRLYRDPDKRYLGGVCAGIAAWLGISPLAVRIIFICLALFWGASLAVYFISWIIIPQAKTTAQKLEMRGEPVNISNIEKNIRESFSESSIKQSFHNFLDEAGAIFGNIFSIFGRITAVLVGLLLCGFGICFAITVIGLFLMQDLVFYRFVEWDFLSFTEMLRYFISPTSHILLVICAVVIFSLLIFAFLFWGVKLITGFKVKSKWLHVSLFFLWIAAIIIGFVVCLAETRNYAWRNEQIVETRPIVSTDTLYISAKPSQVRLSNNPLEIYFDKDNQCFFGKPYLRIYKSEDNQTRLRFSRNSQGQSKLAAYKYAEDITYNVDINDSLLIFDEFFSVKPHDKWKFQSLQTTLYVPVGTVIIADDAIINARFSGNLFRWPHNQRNWVMTEDRGLQKQSF
jgi:Putative stress-responsive transcriptional regulator